MPVNPFSAVGTDAANALDNILQNALPVLLPAIMLLVVAITAVLLFLYLFGFKLGLGEKFKERLRRKKEARRGKFPIAIRRRATKETGRKVDAKSPWVDPGLSVFTESELFDAETIDGDLDYFEYLDTSGKFAPFSDEDFIQHAGSVEANWSLMFSGYKSLDGLLGARNLDDRSKGELYTHAARLVSMKKDALQENLGDWAKQYGDGMASRPVRFVA